MKKMFQVYVAVLFVFVAVSATPCFTQPIIDVTPDSLSFTLTEGDSSVAHLIIRNNGSTTLDFELYNELLSNVSSAGMSVNYPESFKVIKSEKVFNPYSDLEKITSQSVSKFLNNTSGSSTQTSTSTSENGRMFGAIGNQIVEIDLNTGNVLNSFSTPVPTSDGPTGLAFSGKKLYFTDAFSTTNIFAINPSTGVILDSFPAPSSSIDGLAFVDNKLYAQDFSSGVIYELNSENGTLLRMISPPVPIGGGIDGGNGRLFASNFNHVIYELSLTDGSVINSFIPIQTIYGLGCSSRYIYGSVPGGGIDKYDIEEIWKVIQAKRDGTLEYTAITETDIKGPEWEVLTDPNPPTDWPHFLSRKVDVPPDYEQSIECVLLLERLREVNALIGYTRVEAPEEAGDPDERPPMASLCKDSPEWVPACEVHGEGIFIRFKEDVLSAWEKQDSVKARDAILHAGHRGWRNARGLDPAEGYPGIRYTLLHTLAHLLIRELALECGYNAASIRERIYANSPGESPMAGILIYTAAADSDGTLGGLVELGKRSDV